MDWSSYSITLLARRPARSAGVDQLLQHTCGAIKAI